MFCTFDDLTDKHDLYKVETAGDTAMAGHDKASQDGHAHRQSFLAVDLLSTAAMLRLPDGGALRVRVGIHTGSAYSGIVGHKRQRYCLFGDTTNTASRMKSTSFPQRVHVSEATHSQLRGIDAEACKSDALKITPY